MNTSPAVSDAVAGLLMNSVTTSLDIVGGLVGALGMLVGTAVGDVGDKDGLLVGGIVGLAGQTDPMKWYVPGVPFSCKFPYSVVLVAQDPGSMLSRLTSLNSMLAPAGGGDTSPAKLP